MKTNYVPRASTLTVVVLTITLCVVIQSYYMQSIHMQKMNDNISCLEQEYTILQQELNQKKLHHQSYEQKLSEWNKRALSSPQPHETLYQILDIASTSTVMCIQVKQHQPIVHINYTEIPATFHLHGSFEQVLFFFDHLETVTTFALQEVLLRPASDTLMLDVMMKVHTTTFHVIHVGSEFRPAFLKYSTP